MSAHGLVQHTACLCWILILIPNEIMFILVCVKYQGPHSSLLYLYHLQWERMSFLLLHWIGATATQHIHTNTHQFCLPNSVHNKFFFTQNLKILEFCWHKSTKKRSFLNEKCSEVYSFKSTRMILQKQGIHILLSYVFLEIVWNNAPGPDG